ncbi:hypothetical protein TWF594_005989 [Orbilia oligospora]|nr:hypothetical protein TWF706_005822 [Orbilia oligospora]KAF3141432.1 hypothetical protein TWF594_005989 [Orbilia oligospora]
MPITLRHITADSTWLITLTSPHNPPSHAPFNILVDPWIVGPSEVWHPKFAQNHHTTPSSIQSLEELDPQPDILLISQTKSDHCNEATCRQLSKDGSLQVYTVPGADSIVKSWKHFNPENVHRLRPFTSRRSGRVSRIPIYKNPVPSKPATNESITSTSSETDKDKKDKDEDEYSFETDPSIAAIVELAFLPALKPWEIPSIHIGLGITYTPTQDKKLPPSPPLTPPSTNLLHPTVSAAHQVPSTITLSTVPSNLSTSPSNESNPTNTTHPDSPNRFPKKPNSPSKPSSKKSINLKQPGPKNSLTDSLLYTPHGVPPSALTQYLYSLPLPLTAFLHCFVKVDNPKWLGGTVSSGLPNALKILTEVKKIRAEQARLVEEPISPKSNYSTEYPLGVKYLVATHDEEVKLEGFCSHFVKKIKWDVKEVDDELKKVAGDEALEGRRSKELSSSNAEDKIESYEDARNVKAWDGPAGIKLLDLEVGEKAVLV